MTDKIETEFQGFDKAEEGEESTVLGVARVDENGDEELVWHEDYFRFKEELIDVLWRRFMPDWEYELIQNLPDWIAGWWLHFRGYEVEEQPLDGLNERSYLKKNGKLLGMVWLDYSPILTTGTPEIKIFNMEDWVEH